MFLSLIPTLAAATVIYLLLMTFTKPDSELRGWMIDILLLLTCTAVIAKILIYSGA
jgi:hypothetical protein